MNASFSPHGGGKASTVVTCVRCPLRKRKENEHPLPAPLPQPAVPMGSSHHHQHHPPSLPYFRPPSPSPLQPRNALWKNSRKAGHGKNTVFIFPLYEFLECMILPFSLGNCCDDAIFRPGYQTTSCFPPFPSNTESEAPCQSKIEDERSQNCKSYSFSYSPISNWQKFKTGREDRKPRSVVMRKYGEGERKEQEFQFAADRVECFLSFFARRWRLEKTELLT